MTARSLLITIKSNFLGKKRYMEKTYAYVFWTITKRL